MTRITFAPQIYVNTKEELFCAEAEVLHVVEYDLDVTDPTRLIEHEVKKLGGSADLVKATRTVIYQMMKTTTFILEYPPDILTKLAIHVGARMINVALPNAPSADGSIKPADEVLRCPPGAVEGRCHQLVL